LDYTVRGQRVESLGQTLRLFIRMNPLKVLRKLGAYELQGLGRADLHALWKTPAVFYAQIANHGIIMRLRIKNRDFRWTGFPALTTWGTQAAFSVNCHVAKAFIIINYRRVHGTCFFALPFSFRAL